MSCSACLHKFKKEDDCVVHLYQENSILSQDISTSTTQQSQSTASTQQSQCSEHDFHAIPVVNRPSFFDSIERINYEFTNATDFPNEILIENRSYSIPPEWDRNKNFNKIIRKPKFQNGLYIYDVSSTVFDKSMLYEILTSKNCRVEEEVNEWLCDKLFDEINRTCAIKHIKAEIQKHQDDKGVFIKRNGDCNYQVECNGSSSQKCNCHKSQSHANNTGKSRGSKSRQRKGREKRKVNMNRLFGLVCKNCKHDEVCARGSKRATTKLTDLNTRNRKINGDRLVNGLKDILETNGQSLKDVVDYVIDDEPDYLLTKMSNFANHNQGNFNEVMQRLSIIDNDIFLQNFDPVSGVYFTDSHLIKCIFFSRLE